MKRTLLDAIATTRAVAEYWLSTTIAVVAELWRPTGRHRRGWREPSTFEFAAEQWGRMSRVIEAERQPVPEPLEAPKPPTIGERARTYRDDLSITEEIQKILDEGVQLVHIGEPGRNAWMGEVAA